MEPTSPDAASHPPGDAHPPEDWLPVGTRMGEFEILGVVGMGGFGIVYRAFDHDLEREVAVKEYMPGMLANRDASGMVSTRSRSHAETFGMGLRSFVNEARLLARFDHPALLRVFRFWEANGTAYMAMPFYDGQTLAAALKALDTPPTQAWLMAVVEPLIGALDLLHGQQVFHRDIAPDNILLLPSGMPVLLDFGAARRVITDRTQTLTAILKPNYAPIEQYAEVPGLRQGPWTDFYALAAVVYAALSGRPPSPAATRAVIDESSSFAEIGERLKASHGLIYEPGFLATWQRCLAIRPAERPQSAAELRALLGLPAPAPASNSARGIGGPAAHGSTGDSTRPPARTGPGTGSITGSTGGATIGRTTGAHTGSHTGATTGAMTQPTSGPSTGHSGARAGNSMVSRTQAPRPTPIGGDEADDDRTMVRPRSQIKPQPPAPHDDTPCAPATAAPPAPHDDAAAPPPAPPPAPTAPPPAPQPSPATGAAPNDGPPIAAPAINPAPIGGDTEDDDNRTVVRPRPEVRPPPSPAAELPASSPVSAPVPADPRPVPRPPAAEPSDHHRGEGGDGHSSGSGHGHGQARDNDDDNGNGNDRDDATVVIAPAAPVRVPVAAPPAQPAPVAAAPSAAVATPAPTPAATQSPTPGVMPAPPARPPSNETNTPIEPPARPGSKRGMLIAAALIVIAAGTYFVVGGSRRSDAETSGQDVASRPAALAGPVAASGPASGPPVDQPPGQDNQAPAATLAAPALAAPGAASETGFSTPPSSATRSGADTPTRAGATSTATPAITPAAARKPAGSDKLAPPASGAGRANPAVDPGPKSAPLAEPATRPGNAATTAAPPVAPAAAAAPVTAAPAGQPAAEASPLEVCGKRSLVARWTCMKRECEKPQFIQLAECKEERDRAEREADKKERY